MGQPPTPPDDDPASPAEPERPARPRRPGQAWESVVDERIRAAQARGDFDHLSGAGQPLPLRDNPYAGDRALAYHLLHSNGMVPREIALRQEIDQGLTQAEALLERLRRERDALRRSPDFLIPAERQAYNCQRDQIAARYEALLREARRQTLTLSISAPAVLHRPPVDIRARMQAFNDEFPPML